MARWRKDGKELYYITSDGSIMVMDVNASGGVFNTSLPRLLFKLPPSFFLVATSTPGARVDTPDGQRFLALTPVVDTERPEFSAMLNWPVKLKK